MEKTREELYGRAKQMLIDGEDWNKIMDETHLRLKDLKRIEKNHITPKMNTLIK